MPLRPSFVWLTTIACALGLLLLSINARAQVEPTVPELERSLNELVQLYRTGSVDRALDDLAKLSGAKRHPAAAAEWIGHARRAELEGALMLYSEALMRVWVHNPVYPDALEARYQPTFSRLLGAVKSIDRRSRFIRGWYLLWETLSQAYIHRPLPRSLSFLDEALAAFPEDAELHLAAGSHWELVWSVTPDNPRLDPRRPRYVVGVTLARAREFLRRSVALDGRDLEARLRLIRVSLELNDLDAASNLLAGGEWIGVTPALAYLARLFEGAVRERQGDYTSAARAYDAAIALAPQPQSARIARSQLAHLTGARPEAAVYALDAMTGTNAENDPWWVYTKGLVWRFEGYLQQQRAMVRP